MNYIVFVIQGSLVRVQPIFFSKRIVAQMANIFITSVAPNKKTQQDVVESEYFATSGVWTVRGKLSQSPRSQSNVTPVFPELAAVAMEYSVFQTVCHRFEPCQY